MWKPPGIRVQLTLCYTLVAACLMVIFGIAFYTALQASLATSLDTTLQLRSQQVAESIAAQNGRLVLDDIVSELPELDATVALIDASAGTDSVTPSTGSRADNVPRQVVSRTPLFVRILDKNGRTLYATQNFAALVLPDTSFAETLSRSPWRGTVATADGRSIRIYSTALMLVGGHTLLGVVQVGQSLVDVNRRLQGILLGLILATPFLLVLSAFGSYWLAGRAFRPIHRLTRTARAIGVKDLHQRVPVPLAHDEVRDLSQIFNQMIGRLEEAFTQQRRFVADASHELRTPVAVIRNMTDIALSQPGSAEEYIAVLQGVNAESERLSRLINDLLILARADEQQVAFDHDAVRLDLLVTDVVESLESLASERSIILSVDHLEMVTVRGDAARLIQVMISLVDNALTYSNAGSAVTLSVRAQERSAVLLVRDAGIGIAAEDVEHIFERFYRADPARSRAAGGSGLGLSIVDWIVRLHGGEIEVESQVGKGSTFIVTLPREL